MYRTVRGVARWFGKAADNLPVLPRRGAGIDLGDEGLPLGAFCVGNRRGDFVIDGGDGLRGAIGGSQTVSLCDEGLDFRRERGGVKYVTSAGDMVLAGGEDGLP